MTYHNHTWSLIKKGIKVYKHSLSKEQFATEKDALVDFQACMAGDWRKALKRAEDTQDLGVYIDSSRRRRGEK